MYNSKEASLDRVFPLIKSPKEGNNLFVKNRYEKTSGDLLSGDSLLESGSPSVTDAVNKSKDYLKLYRHRVNNQSLINKTSEADL